MSEGQPEGEAVVSEVQRRWEEGLPHDPRSKKIARALAKIDRQQGNNYFDFRFGGDGDNGEELMYLLDIYIEEEMSVDEDDPVHGGGEVWTDEVLIHWMEKIGHMARSMEGDGVFVDCCYKAAERLRLLSEYRECFDNMRAHIQDERDGYIMIEDAYHDMRAELDDLEERLEERSE
jgi:hypothetical protein